MQCAGAMTCRWLEHWRSEHATSRGPRSAPTPRSGSCPFSPSRSRSSPVREPCRSGRPLFVVRADTDRVHLEGLGMKYMLLLGGTMEPEEREKNPELAAVYQRVG